MLAYEANKKPALKMALDNLREITADDIAALPVMKWIKVEITSQKQQLDNAKFRQQIENDIDCHIIYGFVPDPMGTMIRWNGEEQYMNIDRGSIEIRNGRLLWLPNSGGILFQTLLSKHIDPRIMQDCSTIGRVTRTAYSLAYKDELLRFNGNAPVILSQGSQSGPLAQYGVRFS